MNQAPMANTETVKQTEVKERLAPLSRVVCHDDPVSTMDFVMHVFMDHFRLTYDRAEDRMMTVHNQGAAVIGSYPRSLAEKRVTRAKGYARANGFPLTFSIEDDE